MSKTIAIANQKGGVGKTTTAINLSACLSEAGKKVLTLDIDPQGNTSSGLGIDKNDIENSVYELLIGECEIGDCIYDSVKEGLKIIPANINLSGAEIELVEFEDKDYRLKKQLDLIKDQYDYIIIDCPPSLSQLTINALTAADCVLVPMQCEYYALEGLSQLMYTIDLVKNRLNPELYIEGIVFTMFDSRTNLSMQVVENVKATIGDIVYQTVIPRNVRLAEAPSYGMPIIMYDSRSTGAQAYQNLAAEIIERN